MTAFWQSPAAKRALFSGCVLVLICAAVHEFQRVTSDRSPADMVVDNDTAETQFDMSSTPERTKDPVLYNMNPHTYTFVLSNFKLCEVPSGEELLVVILVTSRATNFQERMTIRGTWGLSSVEHGFKVAFLLGIPADRDVQSLVLEENGLYNDIIQEDFLDTYRNLTLKSIMMVRWLSEYCLNAKFALKIDDDVLLNVWDLWAEVQTSLKGSTRTMWGLQYYNSRPVRNERHKSYVSVEQYSEQVYPPYLHGAAYLFTTDCAPLLYNYSLTVRPIPVEDVYLTGIVAQKAGIRKVLHTGFTQPEKLFPPCKKPRQLTRHGFRPLGLLSLWSYIPIPSKHFRCNISTYDRSIADA